MRYLLFTILIFNLFLLPGRPAYAAPEPTPTSKPEKVIYSTDAETNEITDSISHKDVGIFERMVQGILKTITIPKADYRWDVQKSPNFKVSKLETLEQMLSNAQNRLTPLLVQEKIIPTQDKYFVSGMATKCLWYKEIDDPHLVLDEKIDAGKYYSDIIPELSSYYQLTTQMGSILGDTRRYQTDVNGYYNFDKYPPMEVSGSYPDCSNTQPGTPMQALQSTIVKCTSFLCKLGETVARWIGWFDREPTTGRQQLSSKQLTPHYGWIAKMAINATDVKYSYLDQRDQIESERTRGYINTFVPESLKKVITVNEPNGKQLCNFIVVGQGDAGGKYCVNTNDMTAYHTERGADANECLLYPLSKQIDLTTNTVCGPSVTPTPSTAPGGWNCNTDLPEQTVAGLNKDGGQNYADNAYESCANNKENAWIKCNNDVIARAKKAGVDPIFALAIWLHESAASSYKCGEQATGAKIEDFGIHTAPGVPAEDFSKQIDYFLNKFIDHAGSMCEKNLQNFVSMYWIGNICYDQLTSDQQVDIDGYVGEIREIYDSLVGPDVPLPTWPK